MTADEFPVIVTGSRVFECTAAGCPKMWELEQALALLLGPDRWDSEAGMPTVKLRLIIGDCPTGMDFIAKEWAINNWVNWHEEKAVWLTYGKAAGPRRNQEMVNQGANACLGFPLNLTAWSGTLDCMTRAALADIPVYHNGERWTPLPWMIERMVKW
jgi:hypothetical protein